MKDKTNIEYEDIIEDISEETLLSLDELDAGTEEAIAEGKCKKEDEEETDAEINAKLGPKDEEEVDEETVNEAEVNSDEEFTTYAEKVLKKAHGEDYDEKKASATIKGILKKADGDYGAAIGMLTSGLGEDDSVEESVEESAEVIDEDQTAVRFKQLAQTGLIADEDIAKVVSALNLITKGKTISVAQRNLVSDTFLSLVGLVTGDSSIFTKLKQTIKKDTAAATTEEEVTVDEETVTEEEEVTVEETVTEDETVVDHSDITKLVESEEGLTEEFKERATIIFEAAVRSKIIEMKAVLQEEYDTRLIEEVESVKENLTEKIDSYLTYAVESWVEENKVAIESSLRTEIAENFIGALKSVFVEHYIEVPDSKVDLFANLEEEVTKLKEDAVEADRISESLAAGVITLTREKIMTESFKDLADTQVEKLKSLVEDIEFVDATSYKKKIETIKEFYITGSDKETETLQESYDTNAYVSTETIVENNDLGGEEISPTMSRYLTAISRSARASG